MKALIRIAAVLAAATFAHSANATLITGNVNAGGTFAGAVTSSNAWITSSAIDGQMVNFWTFDAFAGDSLSLFVTSSALEFGLSLYQGIVDQSELLFAGFNNAGDFGDNLFIAGTNPVTGAVGTSLADILLAQTGVYTIAIGGEQGLGFDGLFAYDMQVEFVRVPEPGTLGLMAVAMLALFGMRRQYMQRHMKR
jgi:PEP-CTERM motif